MTKPVNHFLLVAAVSMFLLHVDCCDGRRCLRSPSASSRRRPARSPRRASSSSTAFELAADAINKGGGAKVAGK